MDKDCIKQVFFFIVLNYGGVLLMTRKMQIKRGLKQYLPTLLSAEMAFTTDEKRAYIGDGTENIRLLDQKDKDELNDLLSNITPESTTFIKAEKSNNLLNFATAVPGGYYAWNTGKWVARSDIASTDFIECSPNESFVAGFASSVQGGNVTFWNSDKQFISGLDLTAGKALIVPNNPVISFFRISFYSWQLSANPKQYKINKGTTLLPYDDYREYYSLSDKIATNITYSNMPTEVRTAIDKVNNNYLDQVTFFNTYGEVSIQEGRDIKYGTSYWLMRINRETFDGKIILPKLKFTGASITDPAITDVKTFNDKNNYVAVINAGIFDLTTSLSDGIIIKDGVILQDTPIKTHPGQYTLGIGSGGKLKSYPPNVSAADILADNTNRHAVVGFVPIIENNVIVADSILNLCPHANEDNPRQIIGQMANNDYIVCSFDGRGTGEAGLTLKECAEILLNYNVKYAYNLDGGGSTQTFVSKKRINRLLENRPVPNVIVFEKQA